MTMLPTMTSGGLPEDSPANELSQSLADITPDPVKMDELAPKVIEALKTVYDPEIPVNIVDLGLVYDLRLSPQPSGKSRVEVKMTLTAQGCGMGASIAADAKYKILALPGIGEAEVEIVWSPVWNPNMISPEGRTKLGMD